MQGWGRGSTVGLPRHAHGVCVVAGGRKVGQLRRKAGSESRQPAHTGLGQECETRQPGAKAEGEEGESGVS